MAPMVASVCALTFVLALFVRGSYGKVECENLNKRSCSWAVSSTGKRCVLERHVRRSGAEEYTCRKSEMEADRVKDWIESEECIKACGVDTSDEVGISSDSLLDGHFATKLCSHGCYNNCPNIVDLYFNLAAGEGVYLPKFCEAQRRKDGRREMEEVGTSADVAGTPAAAPAPFLF